MPLLLVDFEGKQQKSKPHIYIYIYIYIYVYTFLLFFSGESSNLQTNPPRHTPPPLPSAPGAWRPLPPAWPSTPPWPWRRCPRGAARGAAGPPAAAARAARPRASSGARMGAEGSMGREEKAVQPRRRQNNSRLEMWLNVASGGEWALKKARCAESEIRLE